MTETRHKRGSENRYRRKQVCVRLSDAEHDALTAAASSLGKEPASVLRDSFLSTGAPIGWLAAIQFGDGTYDTGVDIEGLWPTIEYAVEDAATPEMQERLADGQRWRVCEVVPIEDGHGG